MMIYTPLIHTKVSENFSVRTQLFNTNTGFQRTMIFLLRMVDSREIKSLIKINQRAQTAPEGY